MAPARWPVIFDRLASEMPTRAALHLRYWAYNEPLIRWLADTLPPCARIVEVGCGEGHITTLLAAAGYHVDATDLDPEMIARTKRLARALGLGMVNVHSCEHAPSGHWDALVTCGLLEHFEAWRVPHLLADYGRHADVVVTVVPTWHALRNDPTTPMVSCLRVTPGRLRNWHRQAGLRLRCLRGWGNPATARWLRALLPGAAWWAVQRRGYLSATLMAVASAR